MSNLSISSWFIKQLLSHNDWEDSTDGYENLALTEDGENSSISFKGKMVNFLAVFFKQGKLEETISALHSEEWTHGNSTILENKIVASIFTSTNTRLWFRGRWEEYLLHFSLLNKVDRKLNFYSPSPNSTDHGRNELD